MQEGACGHSFLCFFPKTMKFSVFLLTCAILATTNNAQMHEKFDLENFFERNFKNVPSLQIFNVVMKYGKDFVEIANWFSTKNVTLPTAIDRILDNYSVFPKNISTICETHVRYVVKTFLTKLKEKDNTNNEWSIQMIDSLPKPPSGIFNGNVFWMGSFWECIGVATENREINQQNISTTDNYFQGEYCLVDLNVGLPVELKLGLCLPDSCTFEDKSQLVDHWFRKVNVKSKLDKDFCQTYERSGMDTPAKVITGCLLGMIFLVLIGTFVDYVNHKGRTEKVFIRLSIPRNLKKIFDLEKKDGEIHALHGIRSLTLAWIVLGHCYLDVIMTPLDNVMDVKRTIEDHIWFGAILNLAFSVDTFFMIGSMLATFTFLRKMQSSESCNFHVMYLSRYIRITPAFMTTVAMLAGPFYYIGSGPVWPFLNRYKSTCRDSWWKHLTYVFTLLPTIPICIGPTWYLGVDMQMFLVTPLFLYPLYKRPKWGLAGIFTCFVLAVLCQMFVVYYKNVEVLMTTELDLEKLDRLEKYFYFRPWGHFGQYLVGIILGHALHVHFNKSEIVIRPMVNATGWILSFIFASSVLFGTYPIASGQVVATPVFNALYGPLSKQVWTVSIAWMIFACATGNGGAINSILSWKYFVPLSRISFSSYLIHQIVLMAYFGSTSQPDHFDHYRMAYIFMGSMIVTLFLGLTLCLLFEMPLTSLLNDFFFGENKTKPKPVSGDRETLLKLNEKICESG